MSDKNKITVPDIGGATDVDVIEILVQKGDYIEKEASLVTLESDKASMEIPSPRSGTIQSIALNVGDKVSEGDQILTLESDDAHEGNSSSNKIADNQIKSSGKAEKKSQSSLQEITVPDIGGATDVDVIEVLVSEGDEITKDDSLITLESDKASMEIPSPTSGQVEKIKLQVGDKVSEGELILLIKAETNSVSESTHSKTSDENKTENKNKESTESSSEQNNVEEASQAVPGDAAGESESSASDDMAYAGPAVRRLARELGVNLSEVRGSGRKSRITKEDVQKFVKSRLQDKSVSGGVSLPPAVKVDFSRFGEIEAKPLNKIKRLTGENVHRAWISIPHVTQFDEADITELEEFRNQEKNAAKQAGYKLTILAFVCKAAAKALAEFPQFNASLDPNGEQLIYKKYFNVGVAVETPNGLVVPVIKQVDTLSVSDIAKEMGRLSNKARDKGLMPAEMSGGCFTISSLGGIGGTAFTPIVNSPEVAILGLSRAVHKPVYKEGEFVPRLMLPVSLSYDHRVIDGAEAARFTHYLSDCLSDIRKILL